LQDKLKQAVDLLAIQGERSIGACKEIEMLKKKDEHDDDGVVGHRKEIAIDVVPISMVPPSESAGVSELGSGASGSGGVSETLEDKEQLFMIEALAGIDDQTDDEGYESDISLEEGEIREDCVSSDDVVIDDAPVYYEGDELPHVLKFLDFTSTDAPTDFLALPAPE
jgi:hypothetical protein